MSRSLAVALASAAGLAALVACAPTREPIPVTPPSERATAPVVRRTVPEAPPPVVAKATPPAQVATPVQVGPPITLPPNAIYVCVSEAGGTRKQTTIEYAPRVDEMCRKHPEMGPCQYERDICRRSGGRVYAAGGVEITMQTEAEYDKKVMRVRFKAN